MKHHIACTLLLFSLFFCSVSAMEENSKDDECEIKDILTLESATQEDRDFVTIIVDRTMKKLKFPITQFNEKELLKMFKNLEGDLPVLVEQALCKKRANLYTKLLPIRRTAGWWANYGTLLGLRFTAGIRQLNELNISNVSLKQIPDLTDLTNLTKVSAASNNLVVADGAYLPVSLIELDLRNNYLQTLALAGLCNLTKLNIDKNSLTQLKAEGLPVSITVLDAQNNQFAQSKAIQFADLPALKEIELGSNQFTEFDNAQLPTTLTDLSLSYCGKLVQLDGRNLPQGLHELNLFGCKLKQLHHFATHITALKRLQFEENLREDGELDCAVLPRSLTYLRTFYYTGFKNLNYLKNIKTLDLGLHDCTEFPDFSSNLVLKKLNFSHSSNQLRLDEAKLPEQLKVLDLLSSSITMPGTFARLIALHTMRLCNVKLQIMPDMHALASLTDLNMSNNKLTKCDGAKLPTLLQRLNISNNQIQKTDLSGLTQLQKLSILGNKLGGLCGVGVDQTCNGYKKRKEGIAILPTSLETLSAAGNTIDYLKLSRFLCMIKLDLARNNVASVDCADMPPQLQGLNLSVQQHKRTITFENINKMRALKTIHVS